MELLSIKGLSFRVKILLILMGALGVSYFSFWMIETSALTIDKELYVASDLSNQVNFLTHVTESRIEEIILFSRLLKDSKSEEIEEFAKFLKIKKLLSFSIEKNGSMRLEHSFRDDEEELKELVEELGWDGNRFFGESLLIGTTENRELVLGNFVPSESGGGTAYVSVITVDQSEFEAASDLEVFIVEPEGDVVFSSGFHSEKKLPFLDLLKKTPSDIAYHSSKWSVDGESFLAGVHRLKFKDLIIVGLIPETVVFSMNRGVWGKSAILILGILFISIGFLLFVTRRLDEGLYAMTVVADKLSQGVFSFRVKTREIEDDDLGRLAASFNKVAEKIDHMMFDLTERTEQRYEASVLDTVKKYFLNQTVDTPSMQFFGKTFLSPIYGGDWWYADQIRDYLIVVIAKTDSYGIQAALLISSVRAAVISYLALLKEDPTRAPHLREIIEAVNQAIFEVTQGAETMGCYLMVSEISNGQSEVFNSLAFSPYLYRSGKFQPIELHNALSLGLKKKLDLLENPQKFQKLKNFIQLNPGDLLFWHTAGLAEIPSSMAKNLNVSKTLDVIKKSYDEGQPGADQVGQVLNQELAQSFEDVMQKLHEIRLGEIKAIELKAKEAQAKKPHSAEEKDSQEKKSEENSTSSENMKTHNIKGIADITFGILTVSPLAKLELKGDLE